MATFQTVSFKRQLWVLLLLVLATLITPYPVEAGRAVKVGIYQAKPLVYFDADGAAHGFFVEMLNHIAEKEQWDIQYVPGSWQEGLDRLKSNTIDMTLCVGYSEERTRYMDFPKEYLLLSWGVIYKQKGSPITSLLDLEGKRIGALKGDIYLTGFRELVGQFNVNVTIEEFDQYAKVFKAVESGAVTAGIGGNLYGILNEDAKRTEQTPIIFSPIKVGYAVNKGKNGDLIAALDRNIAGMKADKASIYYRELEHMLGKKDSMIPEEAYWALSGVAALLLLAIAWNIMLKRKVTAKTENLETEIVERKRAEEGLSRQKAMFEAIYTCIPDGIVFVNVDREVIGINPAFSLIFGYTIDDLAGKTTSYFYESMEEYERQGRIRFNMTAAAQALPYEVKYRRKDGSIFPGETLGTVVKDADGNLLGYIGVIRDITGRKQALEEKLALEQQFQHTQKLESLGVLAGGIAHDFNNILAIIMGYCSLTKMDYEDAGKHIPEIEKAAERAAGLCRQMLAYAGQAPITQAQVNVRMLVDEMVSMLKTTVHKNVRITPALATDVPVVTGDASQIRQVVMNLIINAAEAIGDIEGEIHVTLVKTEIKAGDGEQDHLGMHIPAGYYLRLEVADNGCGMSDETLRRIFEPFYTTKFTGRGLGMSAVLGIIKAHSGALQLESQSGRGTSFKVYLPARGKIAETEDMSRNAAVMSWQGSGTILLAEDEEMVRSIAIALLEKLGFSVIDAANGREALELYQRHAADITLVLTDMGMPVMNGYELFQKLKQLDPHIPIVVTSGFGEGDITAKIPPGEIAGLINKPYNFAQLQEVLKDIPAAVRQSHA